MKNTLITLTVSLALGALTMACGAKDKTRTCGPALTWSQPVFNCTSSMEVAEPEPEPEPKPKRNLNVTAAPEPKAVLKGNKIEILEKVFFETASADIAEQSFELLDAVAEILVDNPQVTKVRVEGHTDSKGGSRMNRRLSGKRAKAVMNYLVDKGVEDSRLTSKGYGQANPIADNDTEEGRAENRRVEFTILEGEGVEDSN